MAALLKSRTLSVSINCDPKKLYEFVSNPENLPKWAKMFCRSIKKSKGGWIVETPQGPVKVRFIRKNEQAHPPKQKQTKGASFRFVIDFLKLFENLMSGPGCG